MHTTFRLLAVLHCQERVSEEPLCTDSTASCSIETLRACMLLCSAQLGHGALLWLGVQAAVCCHLSPHCFQTNRLINYSKYMQPYVERLCQLGLSRVHNCVVWLVTFVLAGLQEPALLDRLVVQEELTQDSIVGAVQHLLPACAQA